MAKILPVDVPEPMFRELERMAKRESKRLGKEVTAGQLAEKAVRLYIRHMREQQRGNQR